MLEAGAAAAERAPRRRAGSRRRCSPARPRRTPGRRACGPGVVVALSRGARPLPGRVARGARASGRSGHPQGRAHGKLRCGRALARPSRGSASTPVTRLGGASRPHDGRGRGARDRARGRRSLRARLRTGSRDGPACVGDGARSATAHRCGCGGSLSRGGNGRACRRRRRASARGASRGRRPLDAELAPRLEALYHLAWAETYLEHYEDAVAHAERGVAIARAFGQGRLLVPLSLARNFPFEMQGRLRDAIELCESALEAARLSAARTSSIARSSSSAGRCTTPVTSPARSQRTKRASASTRGWPAARSRRRRRPGLGPRCHVARVGRDRMAEPAARAWWRECRPHDARRALLRLGEPHARRACRRGRGRGRWLRTARGTGRCSCR